LSSETPNVREIGGIHTDGGFAEIPELITIIPNIAEGEILGGAGADHLRHTMSVIQRFGKLG